MIENTNKEYFIFSGDFKPVNVYKNANSLAEIKYTNITEDNFCIPNTYNEKMSDIELSGKSELLKPESDTNEPSYNNIYPIVSSHNVLNISNGNLLNQEDALTSCGFVKQENETFYVKYSSTPFGKIVFQNNSNNNLITIVFKIKFVEGTTEKGAFPEILYTDGTNFSTGAMISIGEWNNVVISTDASKTVDCIKFSYGTGSASTWIKDFAIYNGNVSNAKYNKYNLSTYTLPELKGVSDLVSDKIIYQNGNFYKKSEIGTCVFTGNENVSIYDSSETTDVHKVAFNISDKVNAENESLLMCGHFENANGNDRNLPNKIYEVENTNTVVFTFNDNMISSFSDNGVVDKFKAWAELQYQNGTPVTVLYKLETPVYELLDITIKSKPICTVLSQSPVDNSLKYNISGRIKTY